MVTRQAHIRNPIAYYRKVLRNMEIDELRYQQTEQGRFEGQVELIGSTKDTEDISSERAAEIKNGRRTLNQKVCLYKEQIEKVSDCEQ